MTFYDPLCLHPNATGYDVQRCPDCGRSKLRHSNWDNFNHPPAAHNTNAALREAVEAYKCPMCYLRMDEPHSNWSRGCSCQPLRDALSALRSPATGEAT